MSDLYDDAILQAAAKADRDWWVDTVDMSPLHEAMVRALAPLIAAKALRDEAARTYTHTVVGQRNERSQTQRPLYSADVRAELNARADEIERS